MQSKKNSTTTNMRQYVHFFNIIINYKQIHGVNKYVITLDRSTQFIIIMSLTAYYQQQQFCLRLDFFAGNFVSISHSINKSIWSILLIFI